VKASKARELKDWEGRKKKRKAVKSLGGIRTAKLGKKNSKRKLNK